MQLSDRSSLAGHPVVPAAQLNSPSRVPCLVIPVQWALVYVSVYNDMSGVIASFHDVWGGAELGRLGLSEGVSLL